jgi:hypothetical protein
MTWEEYRALETERLKTAMGSKGSTGGIGNINVGTQSTTNNTAGGLGGGAGSAAGGMGGIPYWTSYPYLNIPLRPSTLPGMGPSIEPNPEQTGAPKTKAIDIDHAWKMVVLAARSGSSME